MGFDAVECLINDVNLWPDLWAFNLELQNVGNLKSTSGCGIYSYFSSSSYHKHKSLFDEGGFSFLNSVQDLFC